MSRNRMFVVVAIVLMMFASPTFAQTPAAPEKPRTLWDEHVLFGYLESSYVWNLHGPGRKETNELRFYDMDAGFTFNMAELSIKKDPSERYNFGYGLVVTAGLDAQKNHALGIFRDDDDAFPFRNTSKFDLQEAYASYKIPMLDVTLKAGKFVTLLGYEVIEAPLNPNFSRSFLYSFAIPLTHVGALASIAPWDGVTLTAGPVVGWDVADDNNSSMSVLGQIAVTAVKDWATSLNFITGPEQAGNQKNKRTVLDLVVNWTGIPKVLLGANVDYGWEKNEPSLVAAATRRDNDATWWGVALYGAYDWTERFRTALRGEYFTDPEGVRTLAHPGGAGNKVELWEVTATAQYKIWRGLVGRVEYRHDHSANDVAVFKLNGAGVPTRRSQDTISFVLDYLFF